MTARDDYPAIAKLDKANYVGIGAAESVDVQARTALDEIDNLRGILGPLIMPEQSGASAPDDYPEIDRIAAGMGVHQLEDAEQQALQILEEVRRLRNRCDYLTEEVIRLKFAKLGVSGWDPKDPQPEEES